MADQLREFEVGIQYVITHRVKVFAASDADARAFATRRAYEELARIRVYDRGRVFIRWSEEVDCCGRPVDVCRQTV